MPAAQERGARPPAEVRDTVAALGLGRATEYDVPPPRWAEPWSPSAVQALTTLGAVLVGFLIAAGLVAGRDAAEQQHARKDELVALLHERQDRNEALSRQLEQLRARVSEAESVVAAGVPALTAQLAQVEAAVGLTRLAGPGLQVTFADAGGVCPTLPDDCRIQDTDLQLAVNTLFALGAEAVAVNGERIIATTAIRSAGGAILVNYKVLVSPYVLQAVGDPDRLAKGFAGSQLAADFAIWRDRYGLGFSVTRANGLELPAYAGSIRLRTATNAGGQR